MTTSATTFPARSSARPRITSTLSKPSSVTHSVRNEVLRSIGSTSVTSQSGSRMASTIPGSPAPEPRSATREPAGTSSATTALFSRCRSQSRTDSPGPSRPRSRPGPASSLAYACTTGSAGPKIDRAASGGAVDESACTAAQCQAGHCDQPTGRTTTRRLGSIPSDSLRSPAAAIASCTILRSNAFMALRAFASPVRLTSSATDAPSSVSWTAAGRDNRRCRA